MLTTANGLKKPETTDGVSGLRTAISDNADLATPAWHVVGAGSEPAYQNSWIDAGSSAPRFCRQSGVVTLAGKARQPGASVAGSASVIFTLPAGYRPAGSAWNFLCTSDDGGTDVPCRIQVATNGNVSVVTFGHNTAYLDGINFPTI